MISILFLSESDSNSRLFYLNQWTHTNKRQNLENMKYDFMTVTLPFVSINNIHRKMWSYLFLSRQE